MNRREFIRKLMNEAGLTYDAACRAYTTVVGIVEDSVVNRTKVNFGKVGCLCPIRRPARDVTMGFARGKRGEITRTKRVFHLDERTDYRFKLYRTFKRRTQLGG